MSRGKVLVVGAGIGGLTAGVALKRAGFEVEVYEQADEIREVGAGLTIQCNAVRALDEIGLARGLAAIGRRVTEARLLHWRGRTLSVEPFAPIEQAMGAPAYGIHRAALQSYLLEAFGRDGVRVASRCTGYSLKDGGVELEVADGRRARGDLLVGACGIRSRIRAQLLGEEEPRYAGHTCWRGITGESDLVPDGRIFEVWGPGARFGGVGLGQGRFYWFAPVNAPPNGRDEPGRTKAFLLERYGRWAPPIPQLIEATPESGIFRNDIIDRPPTQKWGDGPVTLLGDAAHPMTPNLGQGACQAIEDAVVLGHTLAHASDLVAGLRRYEDARRDRTRRIVETAWRFGVMAQWESAAARWLRDHLTAWTPRRLAQRQIAWAQRFPGLETGVTT
jgi:2-polyprenyl-6-methoxyphenol hydroxylase-like FAD-dependent oxidoreductase